MREEWSTVDGSAAEVEGQRPRLSVLVVHGERARSVTAPREGVLHIGRAESNEIALDDVAISRVHATLAFGEGCVLTDLGSRNGTRLSGQRLRPNEPYPVEVGQLIEVGGASVLLQRSPAEPRWRRLASHAHFEETLEERCRERRPLGVLRLRLPAHSAELAREVERWLLGRLEPGELLAAYAPEELELAASAARAERLREALIASFGERGILLGWAEHPRDGRSPDALLEAAQPVREVRSAHVPPLVLEPVMRDLLAMVEKVAVGTIPVLILGETGAGKELVAEQVHQLSPRRDRRFLRLNCAAFSDSLIEGELFGYEKGAFTGAERAKAGLLEAAEGGTVFLDEVGELSPALQAKLLRVLEERQVLRLGSLTPVSFDARFVAATNQNLEQQVLAGRFRRDLYFRLNGVLLVVPPLRERPREIPALARRFLEQSAAKLGRPAPELGSRALELLLHYPWPGNVRELKNTMERAVLLASGREIGPEHLPFEKLSATFPERPPPGEGASERARILDALERCAGNQTKAAKLLGISRRTLSDKLDKHQIQRPKKDAPRGT